MGNSVADTRLLEGVTVDKVLVHAEMPDRFDDARVTLINPLIEVDETETSSPDRPTPPPGRSDHRCGSCRRLERAGSVRFERVETIGNGGVALAIGAGRDVLRLVVRVLDERHHRELDPSISFVVIFEWTVSVVNHGSRERSRVSAHVRNASTRS